MFVKPLFTLLFLREKSRVQLPWQCDRPLPVTYDWLPCLVFVCIIAPNKAAPLITDPMSHTSHSTQTDRTDEHIRDEVQTSPRSPHFK